MKKYFVIIPLLFLVYIFTFNEDEDVVGNKSLSTNDSNQETLVDDESKKEPLLALVSLNGENLSMNIDDYIVGVLACEMPASFNIEALKAGAVAARTFYLYKIQSNSSYVATNSDQCFITEEQMKAKWSNSFDKYYDIVRNAVSLTEGEYISYDGKVIESFYFSMSNGYTENIENVFSESRPYLVSVDSVWEKNLNSYEKVVSFSINEFLSKLGLDESDNIDVQNIVKSDSGRINSISINGNVFKGTEIRKSLSLRSTDFDIVLNGREVLVTTRGYGHGVGLSQYGANEMANLGYSYIDILKHYYSGVEVSSL